MTCRACLLATTALLALSAPASAAPGDLDTTYGDGGTVTVTGAPATGLAVAPDGGAVVAGAGSVTPYPYTAHHRLTADGRPAPGYGPVQTVFGYYQYSSVGEVAVQADGRVVVGGGVRHPDWGAYPANYLLRYLPDGRLDPSFGDGGKVILDLADRVQHIDDLAIDGSGRIVFLDYRQVVGRVTPDGRLDPAFADRGWVDVRALAEDYELDFHELALLPDGGLLAVGHRRGTPAVMRLDAAGRLVQSFGTGGVALLAAEAEAMGSIGAGTIALGPDGTFVLAGGAAPWPETTGRFWAIRLTADGRVDPSFGGPLGTSLTVPPGSSEHSVARDAVVQADGKVVLAGLFAEQGEGRKYEHGAVVRLLPDGRPDPAFGGGDGISIVLDHYAGFTEVALQPDGRILLAKYFHLSVTRLDGDVGPYAPAGTSGTPAGTTPRRTARARPRLVVGRRGRAKVTVRCRARRRCHGFVRLKSAAGSRRVAASRCKREPGG